MASPRSLCLPVALLATAMYQVMHVGAERPRALAAQPDTNTNQMRLDRAGNDQAALQDHEPGDTVNVPEIDYAGKSIVITDDRAADINPRLQAGQKGHIIQEATTVNKDFNHRRFWVHIENLAVNVFLDGSQIRITEDGNQQEAWKDKCIRMLRPPARKELQGIRLWRGQNGRVIDFDGQKTYQGLIEDTYVVQMLGQRLEPRGKPVIMFRHEFEENPCPNRSPIAAPNPMIPIGSIVEVHNPIQGPMNYQSMLLNQRGKVTAWNSETGMYVVKLEVYGKYAEFLPPEIRIYEARVNGAPKPKRGDCNYTRLVKLADSEDKALSVLQGKLRKMAHNRTGTVKTAIGKHNAYIGKLWQNQVGLDEFMQNIDTFKTRAAEPDEGTTAELRSEIKKGLKEVNANSNIAREMKHYFGTKLKSISDDNYKRRQSWKEWERHKEHDDWDLLHQHIEEAENTPEGTGSIGAID